MGPEHELPSIITVLRKDARVIGEAICVHGGCDKISLTFKTPFHILNSHKINFLLLHFNSFWWLFYLGHDLMSAESFKRKLTAILSANVKGYSRLMDEEVTIRTLNAYVERWCPGAKFGRSGRHLHIRNGL